MRDEKKQTIRMSSQNSGPFGTGHLHYIIYNISPLIEGKHQDAHENVWQSREQSRKDWKITKIPGRTRENLEFHVGSNFEADFNTLRHLRENRFYDQHQQENENYYLLGSCAA
jgi:hypothetical protein